MAEEYIYTNYSVEDIERYLAGRMNAKEMHELERAALQDAFLADAIEGYRDAPFTQAYQHLDEIATAIAGEKQPAKIVAMPVKANYWWRVAAVAGGIAVAGGVFWYTQLPNNQPRKNLASVVPASLAKPNTVDTSSRPAGNGTASAFSASQSPVLEQKAEGKVVLVNAAVAKKARAKQAVGAAGDTTVTEIAFDEPKRPRLAGNIDKVLTGRVAGLEVTTVESRLVDTKLGMMKDSLAAAQPAMAPAPIANNNAAYYSNAANGFSNKLSGPSAGNMMTNNLLSIPVETAGKFNGFVLDDRKKGVASAFIYGKNGKQLAVTDKNGYFQVNAADSQLAVVVSSPGYQTKPVVLNSNNINNIGVSPFPASFAGVETTEFKKKADKLPGDSLVPEGGWQSFQDYVNKKLHKGTKVDTTADDESSAWDNSIEIEFSIGEDGFAYDVKVVKSLNEETDAKAMEAIQQGPKWIANRKNKKGKVVLKFSK